MSAMEISLTYKHSSLDYSSVTHGTLQISGIIRCVFKHRSKLASAKFINCVTARIVSHSPDNYLAVDRAGW